MPPPPPDRPRPRPRQNGQNGQKQNRPITPSRLTQSAFSAFGTVIENPEPVTGRLVIPSLSVSASASLAASSSASLATSAPPPPENGTRARARVPANQNTALKQPDVSVLTNSYATRAPSRTPGAPVMNMFSCYPSGLRPAPMTRMEGGGEGEGQGQGQGQGEVVTVSVLERHPFTTQTFIPLGLAPGDAARYLVVVAPALRPPPSPTSHPSVASDPERPQDYDRGEMPDVARLRAFVAHGGQAVTYGEGTWHAPMVVVGWRRLDFVVVQACNGVGGEECEEWGMGDGDGVEVWVGAEGGGGVVWDLVSDMATS